MEILIFSAGVFFFAGLLAFVADKLLPEFVIKWLERKLKSHIRRK